MKKRKIDIYLRNTKGIYNYECSTMGYSKCKDAKQEFCIRHGLSSDQVKANFSKK